VIVSFGRGLRSAVLLPGLRNSTLPVVLKEAVMSGDPTKTFPPEDGNGLADDVRSINQRLQRLEDKFD
jgi:hypothetical protein